MSDANQEPTLNEYMDTVAAYAKAKGWWRDGRSVGDDIALMHSELSEALEEHRNCRRANELYFVNGFIGEERSERPTADLSWTPDWKPEGVPAELADVIIRILHFCAEHEVDITDAMAAKLEYNETRPARHGGKAL